MFGALAGGLGPMMLGQGLQAFGNPLMARGQPRLIGAAARNPVLAGAAQPTPSGGDNGMMGFPMGLMSLLGGGGLQGFLPMMAKAGMPTDITSLLGGPQSPLSWAAGTRTIPGGTPEHWLYNLFNRQQ